MVQIKKKKKKNTHQHQGYQPLRVKAEPVFP